MSDYSARVKLDFEADISKAKKEINELQKSLTEVAKLPGKGDSILGDLGLKEARDAALDLQQHIRNAVDVNTGKLDLSRFSSSLKSSNQDLTQFYNKLKNAGPTGQQAFLNVAKAISTAETPLIRVNKKLQEFGTTIKNTAKWQISSSIIHGFMGALQSAYGYAQDLNESLNNIRIVTGQSTEQMAKFAKQANESAKALSTSTTSYTDAALIYYQQGLTGDAVKERTDATIKMANVTGQSASEVSSYMTAIWNNFDDGSKSLEHYADVITALGASTASSSEEIAEGLEKFASIGNTVGLSYEYATSALATVVAQTRQSADTVGTAFKTLFARIQDLELGKTLDDGTTLGQYAQALEKVGINIKNSNGEMKQMDAILDEMGAKWTTLDKATQTALAQNVAGTRQYTQLVALMDNYDKFKSNLNVANDSDGTLQEQADIYAESWEAAQKRVKASMQELYSAIIDDEAFIKLNDIIAKIIGEVTNLITSLGGVKGILLTIGGIVMNTYATKLPTVVDNFKQAFLTITNQTPKIMEKIQKETSDKVGELKQDNKTPNYIKAQAEGIEVLNGMNQKYLAMQRNMTDAEKQSYQSKMKIVEMLYEEIAALEKELELEGKKKNNVVKNLKNSVGKSGSEEIGNRLKNSIDDANKINDQQRQIEIDEKIIKNYEQNTEALKQAKAKREAILQQDKNANTTSIDLEISQLKKEKKVKTKSYNEAVNRKNDRGNIDDIKENANYAKNMSQYLGLDIKDLQDASKVMDAVNEKIEKYTVELEKAKTLESAGNSIESLTDSFNKQDMTVDEVTKSMTDYLNNLKNLDISGNYTQQIDELLNGIQNFDGKDATALDNLKEKFSALGQSMQNDGGIINTNLNDFIHLLSQTDAIDDQVIAALEKMGDGYTDLAVKLKEAKANAQSMGQEEPKKKNKRADMTTSLGLVSGAIMSTISAFNALSNAATVLGDNTATTGQKVSAFASVLMTVGPAIKNIGQAIQNANIYMLAITAAITILIGLFAYFKKEDPYANAVDNAKKLKEKLEEAKTTAENLRSAFDNYDSAVDKLKECTKGTEEWKAALEEVNDQALELLNTYPELLTMEGAITRNADGMLVISQKAQDKMTTDANARVNNTQAASVMAQATVYREKANELSVGVDPGNDSGANWYSYSTLEKSGIQNELGEEIYDAVDKTYDTTGIKKELFNNATELSKLTDQEFETKIEEIMRAFKVPEEIFDSLKQELILSKDALRDFGAATEKATIAEENAAGTIVDNALGNKYSTEVKSMSTSSYLKDYEESRKEELDIINGLSRTDDKDDATVKSLWERYNEANHTNYELTGDAVQGSGAERVLEYYDENGEKQKIKRDEIASTIAASEALNKISNNAELASSALQNMKNNIDNVNVSNGWSNFIASGNFNSMNQTDFSELIGEKGLSLTKDALADNVIDSSELSNEKILEYYQNTFGISEQDVIDMFGEDYGDKLRSALSNYMTVMEDFDNSLLKSTEKNSEKLEGKLNTLSIDDQKSVKTAINKAGIYGGEEGSEKISSMMADMSTENMIIFSETLNNMDWSTEDVNDFQSKLKEAGITCTFTGDQLYEIQDIMSKGVIKTKETIASSFKEIHDIIDGLKLGDTISKEDYDKLGDYGQTYFSLMMDGTYALTGDAEEFYRIVNENSIEAYKKNIQESQDQVLIFQKAVNNFRDTNSQVYASDSRYGNQMQMADKERANTKLEILSSFDAISDEDKAKITEGINSDDIAERIEAVNQLNEAWEKAGITEEQLKEKTQQLNTEIVAQQQAMATSANSIEDLNVLLNNGEINKTQREEALDVVTKRQAEASGLNYDEVIDQANDLAKAYNLDAEAARRLAIQNQLMSKGVETLSKNWSTWKKDIKEGNKELKAGKTANSNYYKSVNELRNCLKDLLGVTDDLKIPEEFLESADNLELIEKAAKGNADAINELGVSLSSAQIKDRFKDITDGLTDQQKGRIFLLQNEILAGFQTLQDNIKNLNIGQDLADAFGGDEALESWVSSLNEMAMATDMSVDEMKAMLNQMGVEAEVVTEPKTVTTHVPEYETIEDWDRIGGDDEHQKWKKTSSTRQTGTKEVQETIEVAQINMGDENKGNRPKFVGNGGSAKKPSGGGGGKGGGGGSTKKETKEKEKDKEDVYYKVERNIANVTSAITKLQKAQDGLAGGALVSALKEENKLLEEQKKNYIEKGNIIAKETKRQQEDLKKYGITFDANGEINNYNSTRDENGQTQGDGIYQQELAKLNAAREAYNNSGQSDSDKETLEAAETRWKEFEEAINSYTDTMGKRIENAEQLQEILEQQIGNNLKAFEAEFQIKFDLTDLEKSWRNLHREMSQNVNNLFKDYKTYMAETNKLFNLDRSNLENKLGMLGYGFAEWGDIITNGTNENSIFKSVSEAAAYVKERWSESIEYLNTLWDTANESWDTYMESIEKTQEIWDKAIENFDTINNQLSTQVELVELLYGENSKYAISYKQSSNTQKLNILNAKSDTAKDNLNDVYYRIEAYRKQNQNIDDKTFFTSEDGHKLYEQYLSARQQVLDSAKETAEAYAEAFELTLSKNTIDLESSLLANNEANSLEELQERWEIAKKGADKYYDSVEKVYNMNSIASKYQDAINKAGTTSAQQKLNKLMERQIKILQEKNELTEADVQLAEKRLAVAQAEIALEDAQANKTSMKLVRDSSGNWSYQYMADSSDIESKKQAVLDKQNDAYKFSKDNFDAANTDLVNLQQEYINKRNEILQDTSLSAEDRKRELDYLLGQYFGDGTEENNGLIGKQQKEKDKWTEALAEETIQSVVNNVKYGTLTEETMTEDERKLYKAWIAEGGQITNSVLELAKQINSEQVTANFDSSEMTYEKNKDSQDELLRAREERDTNIAALYERMGISDSIGKFEEADIKNQLEYSKILAAQAEETGKNILSMKETAEKNLEIAEWFEGYMNGLKPSIDQVLSTLSSNQVSQALDQKYKTKEEDPGQSATGGYTGNWTDGAFNSNGKLAVLHPKELIVNSSQLASIMEMEDNIKDAIEDQVFSGLNSLIAESELLTKLKDRFQNDAKELKNNIFNINAEFPNANNANEIREAILSLPNLASQYLSSALI